LTGLTAGIALGLLATAAGRSHAQELRAFWVHAFAPGIKSRQEVDDLLRRIRMANCNAVFVQVRKGGDAYYQSRYEPWASDNQERFDGLAYLIEQAHSGSPRIQVHAWINTCAVGRHRGNPLHVVLAHPDWLSISDKGETYDGEATKIDPGHPGAADLTFRVYLDVLRHYDVDGIHLDFVRYGGRAWGYNPVSVARFNARYGRTGQPDPKDPLFEQWRRDQVTALVRKIYAMAAAVRPRAAVSAATITWNKGPESEEEWRTKAAAMTQVYQDWCSWMREGILDLNCLMAYYREPRHAAWFRQWVDWAKDHQYGRYAIPGTGAWLNSIPDTFQQIAAVRKPTAKGKRAKGILLYCYAETHAVQSGQERQAEELFEALSSQSRQGPFAAPAAPPELPWKTKPTTGHLKGFVLDANSLLPIDGAAVTIDGIGRPQVTDGTGFYAFVDVRPRPVRVRVTAAGYVPVVRRAVVERGKVTTLTVFAGKPSWPFLESAQALLSGRDGMPVRIAEALVVGGTDQFLDRCFVTMGGSDAAIQVRPEGRLELPLTAGDVVAVRGTLDTDNGERVIRDAALQLVDMRMPLAEEAGKPWKLPTAGDRVVGQILAPGIARISGTVVQAASSKVLLDGPVPTEVYLEGRKAPGVEDVEAPLPAPRLLSRVSVTGVVSLAVRDGATVLLLRPRSFEDIREDQPSGAVALTLLARVVAAPLLMAGVFFWRRM